MFQNIFWNTFTVYLLSTNVADLLCFIIITNVHVAILFEIKMCKNELPLLCGIAHIHEMWLCSRQPIQNTLHVHHVLRWIFNVCSMTACVDNVLSSPFKTNCMFIMICNEYSVPAKWKPLLTTPWEAHSKHTECSSILIDLTKKWLHIWCCPKGTQVHAK